MKVRKLFSVLSLMVLLSLVLVPAGSAQGRAVAKNNHGTAAYQSLQESADWPVWNTFLGVGESNDIAVDASGNIYIIGGGCDALVAKLDSSGTRIWNSSLGTSTGCDRGAGIALDASGNVYVTGNSPFSWGTPINPFARYGDAFVAKLDSSGVLLWHTFLGGSSSTDRGNGIVVDESGNIYITGSSNRSWGTPINPKDGGAFIAKLDPSGVFVWHTFLGGSPGIALDASGNLYVCGEGNDYADMSVSKLNPDGALVWDRLLGSSQGDWDVCSDIALDTSGNIYLTGRSGINWGTPINPHGTGFEVFVAKLDSSGELTWNTFLGGADEDSGTGVAVDASANVYITGLSRVCNSQEALVAKLDSGGAVVWNGLLGNYESYEADFGDDLAIDGSGHLYLTGESHSSWGTPLRPFGGGHGLDAFVARLDTQPGMIRDFACRQGAAWVLESAETSGQGGSMQASGLTFNVGDDAEDRQYRVILSFDTSWLSDNAVLTKVTLKIKRQGLSGTNPFFTHGNLKVDVQSPYFGLSKYLELSDFEAAGATPLAVGTMYRQHTTDWWHSTDLSPAAYPYINRTGTTQFRLRFLKDDNDDLGADYLKFYNTDLYRRLDREYLRYEPILVIEYSLP